MVKNLAQQGVINLSGVRPQLAKGPTKTLQDQTQAPVNCIPVYLACVCVLRFIRWFWLSASILPTITADNRESTVFSTRFLLLLNFTAPTFLTGRDNGRHLQAWPSACRQLIVWKLTAKFFLSPSHDETWLGATIIVLQGHQSLSSHKEGPVTLERSDTPPE
jgi:hypothetical protein